MSTYNITGLDNSSGLLPIMTTIADNAGGWFGGSILLFLFLIIMVRFRSSGFADSLLGAAFITSITAGFLFSFGIINSWVLAAPITVLVISFIVKVWGEG